MVRFTDSADYYPTSYLLSKWTGTSLIVNGPNTVTTGAFGRNGTNGIRFFFGQDNCRIYLGIVPPVAFSGATCIGGIGMKQSGLSSTDNRNGFMSFWDGGVCQATIRMNASGTISVIRGDSTGTVLGTSVMTVPFGVYAYIEAKIVLHASAGTFEVRMNNTNILSGTGANTNGAGTTVWTQGRIGNNSDFFTPTGNVFWDVDDVYFSDGVSPNGDFLGPIRVKSSLPDGVGASSDFVPLSGLAWQMADETSTDGDTTYSSCSTPGDHNTYTFAALGITGVVKAVQVNMMVKSDASGSEIIAPMIRIAGADNQGLSQGISTSYLNKLQMYNTSPATSVAWTVSEIDGAEFGEKLVS